MKFRKKPVVVRAVQWFKNGDHPLDYTRTHVGHDGGELRHFTPEERRANNWEGDIVRYYRDPGLDGSTLCQHCGQNMHAHGWLDTLEGGHTVCPGDWIITGVKGEHYPCKPDIFEATYEKMPENSEPLGEADVWHAGSRSYYHALLLRRLTREEVIMSLSPLDSGEV